MAVTTSISNVSLAFQEIDPLTGLLRSGVISRSVNQAASDSASDTVNGYSFPSTGANLQLGNGGNDTLISNPNTSAPAFLRGSSNTTASNTEIDTLVGSNTSRDHFLLYGLYKGSGYAIIKSFDSSKDYLYFSRGTGGQKLWTRWDGTQSISVGLSTSSGLFNGQTSTFIRSAGGDLLAVLQGVNESLQSLYDSGSLRLTGLTA
jgi:hypothetical protein